MPVSINGDYIPPEIKSNKNNNSNAENLFSKIKKLSDEAVASYHTKKNAKPYVEQLRFLSSSLPEPILFFV